MAGRRDTVSFAELRRDHPACRRKSVTVMHRTHIPVESGIASTGEVYPSAVGAQLCTSSIADNQAKCLDFYACLHFSDIASGGRLKEDLHQLKGTRREIMRMSARSQTRNMLGDVHTDERCSNRTGGANITSRKPRGPHGLSTCGEIDCNLAKDARFVVEPARFGTQACLLAPYTKKSELCFQKSCRYFRLWAFRAFWLSL